VAKTLTPPKIWTGLNAIAVGLATGAIAFRFVEFSSIDSSVSPLMVKIDKNSIMPINTEAGRDSGIAK
jgi:hypothetical protein